MTSGSSGVAPERAQLPLPDYDHLPLGSLRHRVRTLDAPGTERPLAYEREHGDRLPVVEVLRQRLDDLRRGASPSPGSPVAPAPERAPAPGGTSGVSPVTAGPPGNPPSQGVPTNPAQPR